MKVTFWVLVPPGPVTVTPTVPVPAGVVAVICVSLTTATLVARREPNLTAMAPVKPEPLIVTAVPPAGLPWLGLTLVTKGAMMLLLLLVPCGRPRPDQWLLARARRAPSAAPCDAADGGCAWCRQSPVQNCQVMVKGMVAVPPEVVTVMVPGLTGSGTSVPPGTVLRMKVPELEAVRSGSV